MYEGAKAHVWLAKDAERTLAIRQIKIGCARDDVVQVLDGLQPGDRVVTSGAVFIDRVVLFVDGHEVRPTSAEYLGGETLATYRLRGRMPLDAHTLRWYYGLVIDPYPLTIRRADGRVQVEEIGGDAWSRTIDLSGQFQAPRMLDTLAPIGIIGLLLLPIVLRLGGRRVNTKATKDTKKETFGPLPLCP